MYMEITLIIYLSQSEIGGGKEVEKECLQDDMKSINESEKELFVVFGKDYKGFDGDMCVQNVIITEGMLQIESSTTRVTFTRLGMESVLENYINNEGSLGNRKVVEFENPFGVDKIFRGSVRSSGDSSQIILDFLKNIHVISKQFYRMYIDSFDGFMKMNYDNVGIKRTKTVNMKRADFNYNSKYVRTNYNQELMYNKRKGFNMIKCPKQNKLLVQCKERTKFEDLNLDRKMKIFLMESYARMKTSSRKKMKKQQKYMNIFQELRRICKQENYEWDRSKFICGEVDPKFDEMVTRARENMPDADYESNRQFYLDYNIRKFIIFKDTKDDGETFHRFANEIAYFAGVCEAEGLRWPFEKLYWEHWEMLKRTVKQNKAEWLSNNT
jgi:hypothetical protein